MSNPIQPINKHALALKKEDAAKALERLKEILCTSPEAAQFFEDAMARSHQAVKELEEERQALTKPLQDEVKSIQAEFRPVEQAMEAIKQISKQKIQEYRTQVALAAEASRQKAIAAAQVNDTVACSLALAEVPDEVPSSFEWYPILENALVLPREFLEVSATAINNYCKKHKNSDTITSVPGIKFERRATVRVKGK